jgi:PE-PPE domain/PE family
MTFLITEPEIMAAVAGDVEHIGSAIGAANAAAAGPTSGVIGPAANEVSAAVTKLFGQFGREYQALVAQAAIFHSRFAQALTAAGGAYATAEATASNLLGGSGAAGVPAAAASLTSVADPLFDVAIVMGGSGNPLPDRTWVADVLEWATTGGFSWNTVQEIFTPEGLYPLTGVRSLPLNTSVSQGLESLDAAISQQITAHNSVLVQSYSQSSIIASLEMQNLANGTSLFGATPPTGAQLGFNLLADPMNPNGGLLERFAGLVLPSIGLDFYGATPANTPWTTNIFSLEYDGFADFPRYPIDFLSDLNAVAGIVFVHPTYPKIDPSTISFVKLPVSTDYAGPLANTTYYMGMTPNLPLLDPLRDIPLVGNPLADLLQPDLTYLVNWGYGNPAYGYSTAPANVPTPFGLFPPLSATTVLPGDLITGAQQGISAAASDFMAEGASGLSLPSLSPSGIAHLVQSISLPSHGTLLSPASIGGFIQSLQTAGTDAANAFSKAAADGYGVLLPTADILNAAVIPIPTYDANLFLAGIAQAAGGNPVGLINAVGDPLAATTGLVTVAGGVEGLVLAEGSIGAIKAITSLIP